VFRGVFHHGSEERVNEALKAKGYREFYTPSNYGQLKRFDINHNLFLSETEAVKEVSRLSEMLRK